MLVISGSSTETHCLEEIIPGAAQDPPSIAHLAIKTLRHQCLFVLECLEWSQHCGQTHLARECEADELVSRRSRHSRFSWNPPHRPLEDMVVGASMPAGRNQCHSSKVSQVLFLPRAPISSRNGAPSSHPQGRRKKSGLLTVVCCDLLNFGLRELNPPISKGFPGLRPRRHETEVLPRSHGRVCERNHVAHCASFSLFCRNYFRRQRSLYVARVLEDCTAPSTLNVAIL